MLRWTGFLMLAAPVFSQGLRVTLPNGDVLAGDPVQGDLSFEVNVPGPIGDSVASASGFFVGNAHGEIWRVDPGQAVLAFTVPGGAVALAEEAGSILVGGTDGTVRRVIPSSGTVIESWSAPSDVSVLHYSFFSGRVAGTWSGKLLREVNGSFVEFADLGAGVAATGILEFGGDLFLVTTQGALERRTQSGQLIETFHLPGPATDVAEHLTDLLVSLENGNLLRLDRETGQILFNERVGTTTATVAVRGNIPFTSWAYCYGDTCPCGNEDDLNGCRNSTGLGAYLLGSGTNSVTADDLNLVFTHMPPNGFHVLVMGQGWGSTFLGDGRLCIDPSFGIFRFPISQSSPSGFDVTGTGLVGRSHQLFGPAGRIQAGQTWHFQGWYRDGGGPCGAGFNVTNAFSLTFGS